MDVERPKDEGMAKEDIEYMIEKKRIRVTREARNKAEKAKQQSSLLSDVVSVARKGGIPNHRLRGINEADFFQKNNQNDKGWTLSHQGNLV